jgi:multidrug efflux pump subunit AcrA (membrane-fusion protein)
MNKIFFLLAILLAFVFSGCRQNNTVKPIRKDIVEAVFASGNVISDNYYIVTSQTEGYLDKTFFNEGDSVKTGQILFRIENKSQEEQLENAQANYEYSKSNAKDNSPVLEQLIAQKLQIKNKLETDSINFIRHQRLIKTGAVSRVDFEKAKLAYDNSIQDLKSIDNQITDTKNMLHLEVIKNKANLASQQNSSSFYEIISKVDGMILQIHKTDGELIKRGEHISEIGSGEFIAKLFIVEEDINKIEVGQEVFIELNTDKNKTHKAYLSNLYPFFDSQEQSFIAEAKFVEPINQLKSGTQLQANIKINDKKNTLVIPTEFLLPGDFILSKNKQKFKVSIGIRTSEWVEILSGIDEATTILFPY